MNLNAQKVRLGGSSGPCGKAILDPISYKLRAMNAEDDIKVPVLNAA